MNARISNVIFTRNRPLQLEGYLESLFRHLPQRLLKVYIIYKVDLFDEQYSSVFKKYPDCIVLRERDFHDDFVKLFEAIDTEYVLFATDDVVYFDSVDFGIIEQTFSMCSDIFGFTFKFGPETFSNGNVPFTELRIDNQITYKLNWKNAKDQHARYPFELNSTIYRTSLVQTILSHIAKEHPTLQRILVKDSLIVRFLSLVTSTKHLLLAVNTFCDPNTLEGYGYRWCRKHKRRVPSYLYFQKLCATTLQVNRVNTSVPNPVYGTDEHSVEFLNERYKQGYRLDIEAIARNKPDSLRVGCEFFRLKRQGQSG